MKRFLLFFIGALAAGIFVLTLPPVKHVVSEPWGTVLAAATHWLVSLWDGEISQTGNVLRDARTGFAVSVDAECNGVDAVVVLWAAIIAFPATYLRRALGLLLGLVLIQSLNLIRIMSLLYLGSWNQAVFTWVHHNLWQGLMILGVMLTFMLWLWLGGLQLRRHPPGQLGTT